MYLVAILDWYSRYVLAWALSNTLETTFCLEALGQALSGTRPAIFNTDQGSQFTSAEFTGMLIDHDVAISMDGRGRVFDNIFVERLWRSVKYELIYLNDFRNPFWSKARFSVRVSIEFSVVSVFWVNSLISFKTSRNH